MKVFIRCYCFALLSLFSLVSAHAGQASNQSDCRAAQESSGPLTVIGEARSLDGKALLYCEYHFAQTDSQIVLVEYRDPSQQLIARKQLDFTHGLLWPNVEQEDFRHGELRQVDVLTGPAPHKVAIAFRKANAKSIKQSEIKLSDSLVVDAGFDHAVRQYWNLLNQGKKITIDFVSPVHLRSFSLTIRASASGWCAKHRVTIEDHTCFVVQPSSKLLSFFVKPLVLVYRKLDKRLLSFRGSVNLSSADGSALKASIRYHYVPIPQALVITP